MRCALFISYNTYSYYKLGGNASHPDIARRAIDILLVALNVFAYVSFVMYFIALVVTSNLREPTTYVLHAVCACVRYTAAKLSICRYGLLSWGSATLQVQSST